MVSARHINWNRNLKYIPIMALLAIMTACASPAKKACLQTDWQRVGFTDGSQGKMAENSASQRDNCIKEGAPPDMTQYTLGRRQGLEKYCTAENALAIGQKGEPYHGVCPQALQGEFLDAYQKGLQAYGVQLEKEIKSKKHLQDKLRQELAGVEEEIAFLEDEIAEASQGQARLRMGMISEMKMLDRDEQSLTLQISALEMDIKEMRERVSSIKEETGSRRQ